MHSSIAKQRGDQWPVSDDGRVEQQWRFVKAWLVLVGISLVCSQAFEVLGVHFTPSSVTEIREEHGDHTVDEFVFTHVQHYDDHAIEVALTGMLAVLLGQWLTRWPRNALWRTVGRNLAATVAFFAFILGVQGLRSAGVLQCKPSGHFVLYILTSYLHLSNATTAARDLSLPSLAAVLLANIPFEMYCSVWTVLVFHTLAEVCTGVAFAVGVIYSLHYLRLDA